MSYSYCGSQIGSRIGIPDRSVSLSMTLNDLERRDSKLSFKMCNLFETARKKLRCLETQSGFLGLCDPVLESRLSRIIELPYIYAELDFVLPILSVCLSVCLSVRPMPVLYLKEWTYRHML